MSDNYRALTRTYRPLTFDDIVSQHHVSDTLKNAIKQNRLAHAYMFCGPRGVGKTTMARVLARTVNNIEQEVDGESLNRTLNVIEIDAASNNGVDDIRDLRERVRIPPQNGRYKIYIIDEVHMLSKAAFNALLKTLEEPPDHVIFIFATTEPQKVLPTILSRVQRFDFKRISIDEIVSRLATVAKDEEISIDNESLHVIAKKADGALRDAIGLLDQAIAFCGTDIQHGELLRALNVVSTDRMFQFMDTVENNDAAGGLQLIDELLQEGYDIQEFLVGLTEHLRNLYVAQGSESMHLVEASAAMKERYQKVANVFSEDDLMRMLHIVSEAQFKVKEAHQPKIQFEITLLKLIHMERSQKLDALIQKLDQLKKNGNQQRTVAEAEQQANDSAGDPNGKNHKSDLDRKPDQHDEGNADDENLSAESTQESEAAQAAEEEGQEIQQQADSSAADRNGQDHKADQDGRDGNGTDEGAAKPKTAGTENDESASEIETADTENYDQEEKGKEQPELISSSQTTDKGSGSDEEQTKNNNEPVLASSPQNPTETPAEDALTNIFGSPSLGNGSATITETVPAEKEKKTESKKAPGTAARKLTLQDVRENWDDYVTSLKDHVQQMLYFQMQRVQPVKLKNRELLLRCNDDFAKTMVEEHKRELAKILEGKVGGFLQLSCVVKKEETDVESSMSPYERFKQLQERDPQVKTLVELFGAELDYNLNQ
jgi:DNA polymerase-3 subunit gamma/tau